ncbi:MAG: 50S ribosomal protein L16 [Candidatus Staskawiczbacteria bacterium]|nr:50S ribosomal protein L16 [Candidatus Staskawiczbacteria bacterium]
MLMPKKVKHRKWHKGKGRSRGSVETRATTVNFGSFGLKSMETKWITARQLEASRRYIIRYLKKGGKLWIRIFPDKPVTFKGAEVGMGGGKGAVDHYVYAIKPGRMIFELDGLTESISKEALEGAGRKLPIKTKFVKKDNI